MKIDTTVDLVQICYSLSSLFEIGVPDRRSPNQQTRLGYMFQVSIN